MPGSLDPLPRPEDHALGPADAPFVLTMYEDFECPFCQAAQSVVARVRRRLGPELRLVVRHFPIPERHPLALQAANAAEAGAIQGAFWELHEALYDLRGKLQRPELVKAAKRLGLDTARFEADLDGAVHAARIEADVASGERSGVQGTPAFFAGSALVEGAFDAGSLVDALRASVPG